MGKRATKRSAADGHRSSFLKHRGKTNPGGYKGEDFSDLVRQLSPLGLRVCPVDADGNCLFRAFADQLCGDAEQHASCREECCDYMSTHTAEFAIFHADEDFEANGISFDAYVQRMRSPGSWGSQLELMALCRKHEVNVIVHQSGSPSYEMLFASLDARCLQLSYHDGEHYNSVRFSWDTPGSPALHFSLQQLRPGGEENSEAVQQVRDLLPSCGFCSSDAAIRAALLRFEGDVDAAAELLLREEFGVAAETADLPEATDSKPSSLPLVVGARKEGRGKKSRAKAAVEAEAPATEVLALLLQQLIVV